MNTNRLPGQELGYQIRNAILLFSLEAPTPAERSPIPPKRHSMHLYAPLNRDTFMKLGWSRYTHPSQT